MWNMEFTHPDDDRYISRADPVARIRISEPAFAPTDILYWAEW
jgi:hypothetical protein